MIKQKQKKMNFTHNNMTVHLLTKKEDANRWPAALNIDWLSDQDYNPIDWVNTSVLVIQYGNYIRTQRLHHSPGFKTGLCKIVHRLIHGDELITIYIYIKNGEYVLTHKIENSTYHE